MHKHPLKCWADERATHWETLCDLRRARSVALCVACHACVCDCVGGSPGPYVAPFARSPFIRRGAYTITLLDYMEYNICNVCCRVAFNDPTLCVCVPVCFMWSLYMESTINAHIAHVARYSDQQTKHSRAYRIIPKSSHDAHQTCSTRWYI